MKALLIAILILSLPLLSVAEDILPLFPYPGRIAESNISEQGSGANGLAEEYGLLINDWNELPPGIFGSIYAIVVFNGSVYVAGDFLTAGNVAGADYIARWDGCQWYAEAPGMTGPIYKMVFIGDDIYAGGDFLDAGGNYDADKIAFWDGTQWNSLGPGLNGSVFAIAGNTNEIYVGGAFTEAGGNSNANRIAKWNGTSWIPLGSGLNDAPYSIVLHGGQIFVGGDFTDAGGNDDADYIAQWSGSSWQDVGNGLNSGMWNMAVNGPDIYMIGSFTEAGGNPEANLIARWTGSEWQNVGNYFQASNYVTINTITIADDYLYLGVSDGSGMAWVMQCDLGNDTWIEHPPYYPDSAPIGAIGVDENDIYVGNIQTSGDEQGGGGDGGGCWGGGGFTHHHGSSRGNGGILRWGEVVEQIIIEGVPGSVCQNENPFSLPTIQSGYPGNWSGPGVTGNTFDPENVQGWLLLTFTPDQSPCPLPVSIDILVEMIVIDPVIPAVICGSDPSIQLNEIQSGIPGSWSGTGVNNNQFDPSGLSGVITLTFTPAPNQCAGIATDIIEVVELITPVISGVPESICETNDPINLSSVQDGIPGNWTGQGVNANVFDPTGLNGTITLTFSPTTGTCVEIVTADILVENAILPIISGVPGSLCETDNVVPLNEVQNGMNGNWSGPGVAGNTFDPSGLSGNVSITFTPVGECVTAALSIITVNEVIVPVISGIPFTLCENNDAIVLPVLQNGISGQWSGPGISNNTFNPENLNGLLLFTFTPDANQCAGIASFQIVVEPFTIPVITNVPSELCETDVPVNLNTNQNGITGNWTGPGIINNVFNPQGLGGTINLTFIPNDPCASIATTDINVTPAIVPIVFGIPITMCQTEDELPLPEMLQQIAGNWSGPGVMNNMFNPDGQNGNVTITFTPENGQCALTVTTSIEVSATAVPIITGIPTSLCYSDSELLLPGLISGITGNWSGQNVTDNVFNPYGLNGNFTLQFSPEPGKCSQEASTNITIHTSPAFINLVADCDSTAQTYTVSFDIISGDPSSYTVNGMPVGGTHFTSPPISSGNTEYNFTIDDVNGCGLVQIQGNLDCTCATFAGSMFFPGAPVKICEGSDFSAVFNGDANLDPDDVMGFVLHDQAGTQLGTVYAMSNSSAFTYPSGIVLGQIYYVSPMAGSNNGLGNINLLDPCLSVSQGVPVIFYRPEVKVSGGGSICPTACITYTIEFSGEKPYELLYQVNANGNIEDKSLSSDLDQVVLTICPADYGITNGILDIIPLGISDANCTTLLSPVAGIHTTVHPVSTSYYSDILCPGQTIVFNATVYDQDHPSGIQTLQTTEGCDSIIEINLSFYEPAQHKINQVLCFGGSMVVNGTEYNESHPAGTEVMAGGSVNGCDSIITVQLNFNSVVASNLIATLCPGESIYINGNTYNESHATGTELFPGGSAFGCDSIVNIQLSFSPPAESAIKQTLCKGEWLEVNGTVYNETHTSGFEVLLNASALGCDSVVNIELTFLPAAESEIIQTLCKGEWIEVNGTVYDEAHTSGVEVMLNASVLGCDSTIKVNLFYYPEALGFVIDTLVLGKSIVINGTEYNQSNPTGIEVLPGGSVMGCDSIITIALYFSQALSAIVQTTAPICHGDSTGEILVEEISGGLAPYLFSLNGANQWTVDVLPVVIPGLPAGTYKLVIGDGLSATIEFNLVVPENPELTIDAGTDMEVEDGKDLQLNAKASFPVAYLSWSPVEFLSCTDCPDPVAENPDRDILYTVMATDDKGCHASDDILLTIMPEDDLYVPTVFSPNGDGVNDTWRIYSSDEETRLISLSIMDRWGGILFQCSDRLLNDSGVEWDGSLKGSEMGAGVYLFVAVVQSGDLAYKHLKGDITVIR
jgi:gliding motility-associated-like protein